MPSRMVQSPPSTIGNAPLVEDDADGVSELGRVVAQPVGIEQAGGGVDGRVEGRGSQPGAAPGAQPLGEPGREQGFGQALDPGGAQAQVGGRLDDHTGRHLRPPTGTTDTAAKSVKRALTSKFRFNLVATNGQVIATSLATVLQAALIPVASSGGHRLQGRRPRSPGHDGPPGPGGRPTRRQPRPPCPAL